MSVPGSHPHTNTGGDTMKYEGMRFISRMGSFEDYEIPDIAYEDIFVDPSSKKVWRRDGEVEDDGDILMVYVEVATLK